MSSSTPRNSSVSNDPDKTQELRKQVFICHNFKYAFKFKIQNIIDLNNIIYLTNS